MPPCHRDLSCGRACFVPSSTQLCLPSILPSSWRPYELNWQGLSTAQLGNVPFSLLKAPSCFMRYGKYPWSAIYYCEMATKRLILVARPQMLAHTKYKQYICVELFICPIGNFPNLVEILAYLAYEPETCGGCIPGTYPVYNSYLFSLLEDIPIDQYPPILEKYITDLDAYIVLDNQGKTRAD